MEEKNTVIAKKKDVKDVLNSIGDNNNVEIQVIDESKDNPYAICTASVGREDKKKFESCVRSLKKKKDINESELEADKGDVLASTSDNPDVSKLIKLFDDKLKPYIKNINNIPEKIEVLEKLASLMGIDDKEFLKSFKTYKNEPKITNQINEGRVIKVSEIKKIIK